jgi:uncharacterized protein YdeI (YjbR/CyaY-like superfamily)
MKESGWVKRQSWTCPVYWFHSRNRTRATPTFLTSSNTPCANAKALENFRNLAPSHRRYYIHWIMDAKKEETRKRRLREAVSRLEQSKGDPDDITGFVEDALMANTKARENFRNLAPSHRRHYLGWIMHAAKDEPRERRLREGVSLLEQNKKLGLK